jgi:DNA gyrase/topoisomerase IV subunit A
MATRPAPRPVRRTQSTPTSGRPAVKPTERVARRRTAISAHEAEMSERLEGVQDLLEFANDAILRYGTKTNEDRAIPAYQDGCKPVQRRAIYAARRVVNTRQGKTARLVGEVIGTLHPHGDASISDAISTMVTSEVPCFEGFGNWGSLLDPPAAIRYTELKLSVYGHQFLHPNYLPVIPMVPNYDDQDTEPAFLPALLPNILLQHAWGIGTGVNTIIPAFTPTSLLPVIIDRMKGKEFTAAELVKRLEFMWSWGGKASRDKANLQRMAALFTETNSETIHYVPHIEVDEAKRTITMFGAPPNLKLDTFVKKVQLLKPVASVGADKKGVAYTIRVKRGTSDQLWALLVARVRELAKSSVSYAIYVAKRTPVEETKFKTTFHRFSVIELINAWIEFRLVLEVRSLMYRMERVKAQVTRLKLMMLAADNLTKVFAALKSKDPDTHLVASMKITLEEAGIILGMRVRQLSTLDRNKCAKAKDELVEAYAQLKAATKNPAPGVIAYLQAALQAFEQSQYIITNCDQWRLKSSAAMNKVLSFADGTDQTEGEQDD